MCVLTLLLCNLSAENILNTSYKLTFIIVFLVKCIPILGRVLLWVNNYVLSHYI